MTMPWNEQQTVHTFPVQKNTQTEKVRVQLMGGSKRGAWDEYVKNHENGTFFHLYGWSEVVEETYGYVPLYLIAISDEKARFSPDTKGVVGVLPLSFIRSPLMGNNLVSTAFTVGGGLLADTAEVADLMADYAQNLEETRAIQYIELRGSSHALDEWKVKDSIYAGFVKEMPIAEDENLKMIPRKKRADVRKGIKALGEGKLTVDFNAKLDDVYAIYAESVRNLGTPVFPKALLANIKSAFKGDVEFTTISSENGIVASLVSYYFKDTVLPYYGGAKFEARKLHAYDLMYWVQMRQAVSRGARHFDFGRSKVGTGAYDYKGHWGFEAEPLRYYYWLAKAKEMPDVNPNNPKYNMVTKVWKKLPLSIANQVGPLLARHLS